MKQIDRWEQLTTEMQPAEQGRADASRAVCHLELGNLEDAAKFANQVRNNEQANEIDRNRAETVLAVCMAKNDQLESVIDRAQQAVEELERSIDTLPTHVRWQVPRTTSRLVTVLETAGRQQTASKWKIKQAINLAAIQAASSNHPLVQSRSKMRASQARQINGEVWDKVRIPGNTILDDELNSIRDVARKRPRWKYLMTLAVAEFRSGDPILAISAATRSNRLRANDDESEHPINLAILALSHHQLGLTSEANEYQQAAIQLTESESFRDDDDCQQFCEETKTTLLQTNEKGS